MRLVSATFASATEMLAHLDQSGDRGGLLFAETRADLDIGETVLVDLTVGGWPSHEMLRVKVETIMPGRGVWTRVAPHGLATMEMIAQRLGHDDIAPPRHPRHHDRFPLHLPCYVTPAGSTVWLLTYTGDVSAGGAFIKHHGPPEIGAALHVDLPAGFTGGMPLAAHVAWRTTAGRWPGMGAVFDDTDETRPLREHLRHALERGIVDATPAAPF